MSFTLDKGNGETKKRVVVLGAGVIGLTTALRIQEKGLYQVEIIAEILPTDPKTYKYTSQWAGAHHRRRCIGLAHVAMERSKINKWIRYRLQDFRRNVEIIGAWRRCFRRLRQIEYYASEQPRPNTLERMPGFEEVPKDRLFLRAVCGYSFDTVTIDVPVYLNYLLSRFLEKGGSITRGHVQHIQRVLEGGSYPFPEDVEIRRNEAVTSPDAVIVCVGLGARFLGGVEDRSIYPSQGQTVILRAPWVQFGKSFEGESDEWIYIIPRKGGNVVIGGTQGVDDRYPAPRPETTRDLLRRALELCPELDLLPIVVEDACGLRPKREGGFRIELEYRKTSDGRRRISVVHNYGHGSKGYIASIGSAEAALELMEIGLK
ncbi:hypothetical protein M413DRAFT_18597 [Hebeloma cylindrosporum]|uniref:FAD dependent oxidoreductase domain-containing protein n=1 Tax=Hebeloma cylindrosporum TaxID=76867 RepID=A0A0C2XX34_HEBCY|nr:hypothetical protein M413DRAFT_18597 [Hebeloma cylindrosporum h7]